jgi:hypothetical protein
MRISLRRTLARQSGARVAPLFVSSSPGCLCPEPMVVKQPQFTRVRGTDIVMQSLTRSVLTISPRTAAASRTSFRLLRMGVCSSPEFGGSTATASPGLCRRTAEVHERTAVTFDRSLPNSETAFDSSYPLSRIRSFRSVFKPETYYKQNYFLAERVLSSAVPRRVFSDYG